MPIKTISIEKSTKAVRLDKNTVMLNLEAVPLDEENNFEPGVELQLFINDQLIDTLDSGISGKLKTKLAYKHGINDSELISFKLKNITSGIESKIKYILIEDRTGEKIVWGKKLYDLNKELLKEFSRIDQYFRKIISSEEEENYEFINQEFAKLEKLGQIKTKLLELKQLEFYIKYKDEIEETKDYCYHNMTIQEIDSMLNKIAKIATIHNINIDKFRKESLDEKNRQEKIKKIQKRYDINKSLLSDFQFIDQYFQGLIKPENYQDNDFVEKEFDKLEKLGGLKVQLNKLEQLEFYIKYKNKIESIKNYCNNQMTVHEIDSALIKIVEIIKIHDTNIDKFRNERKENERKENERKENERKENERKENERKENERKENERKENERKENERKENERKENERKENERKENERKENERKENERKENERKENERKENERKNAIISIKSNRENIKSMSIELRDNKEIILIAVEQNGYALKRASNRLKDDKQIVLSAVKQNGLTLNHASDKLQDNEEIVLAAINQNPSSRRYVSERLRNNKKLIITFLEKGGGDSHYGYNNIPDNRGNDREIVLAALKYSEIFEGKFKSHLIKFKNDKDVLMAAIENSNTSSKSECPLEYASDKLKDDENIVLSAVKKNGYNIKYASEKLKDNKEMVLAAINENPHALEYVSDRLKDDENIVLQAIVSNGYAFKHASEKLKNNKNFILSIIEKTKTSEIFTNIGNKLRDDKEIFLEFISRGGSTFYVLNGIPIKLQNDRTIAMSIVEHPCFFGPHKPSFHYLSDQFKNDKEIFLTAIKNSYPYSSSYIIQEASPKIKLLVKMGIIKL
ncbi:MAG: DUF4116 domain-containing protein [Candidatus Absconditicoccaceae bacterium]